MNTQKTTTLLSLAASYVSNGSQDPVGYLDSELPGEDHDREVTPVFDGVEFELFRDGDSYFLHTSVGFSSGEWSNLETDYPSVFAELPATGKTDCRAAIGERGECLSIIA